MSECIFDKIVNNEVPSKKVWENEKVVAFWDISPEAPVHVIIIPKKHIEKLSDVTPSDKDLLGELLLAVVEVSRAIGVDETGFRLIMNNGSDAGQIVPHIHFHLIGGKKLGSNLIT